MPDVGEPIEFTGVGVAELIEHMETLRKRFDALMAIPPEAFAQLPSRSTAEEMRRIMTHA